MTYQYITTLHHIHIALHHVTSHTITVYLQCIDSFVHAATYAEGNGFVVEQSCGKEGRISETFRHRGYLSLTNFV